MTQKEKRRDYWKEYYQKHKGELNEKHKKFLQSERGKEYRLKYYRKNKEKIYSQQQEYIARNRKKITRMMVDCRKRNAEKFAAEGQMYCYLPRTERENKMVKKLSKEFNLTEVESRKLLEERNWNIKSLLVNKYKVYDEEINLIKVCNGIEELTEFLGGTFNYLKKLDYKCSDSITKKRNKKTKTWCYIVKESEE